MIPTHKLHHALVLAEHRSFRQAAEALNLSQPALTRSIQSLERTLGVRLFDRDRAAIELTVFGRIVVDRARETLLGLKELEQEIQLVKGLEKGVLEISLAPYPSALSGQRAVSMFLAEHPEVHCRVRVVGYADVAEDVERGRCDVGIADVGVASDKGLTTECLSRLQLYFVARPQHPLARRRRCAVEDLVRFPWASIRAPSRVAVHLPSSLGRAGRWDTETGEFVPSRTRPFPVSPRSRAVRTSWWPRPSAWWSGSSPTATWW